MGVLLKELLIEIATLFVYKSNIYMRTQFDLRKQKKPLENDLKAIVFSQFPG